MDFESLVPDRELCERLRDAGICQDEPELWWFNASTRTDALRDKKFNRWEVMSTETGWEKAFMNGKMDKCIAPTLPMMMEELEPEMSVTKDNGYWKVICEGYKFFNMWTDKHLPNAVALALLKIAKEKKV